MTENTLQADQPVLRRNTGRSRVLILTVGAVIIFVLSYLLAWGDSYRLSVRYLKDADRSFDEGRYLDALVGFAKYSQSEQRYVEYGGYMQVERIWSDRYAYPEPGEVRQAAQRVDEIINSRLTIEDAEQFVQENIGRNNPYLGLIYLRLGELYEANGQLRDAEDIYVSIPDLFASDEDLIERARINLENLQEHSAES